MNAHRPEADPAMAAATEGTPSPWRPFRHAAFAVIWAATVVSNIGTWMYSAASGWLMTSLAPDPLMVSMVQVATTLPMFLLALPAGALADVVDRRRLLIATELVTTAIAALFAAVVGLDLVTPGTLLLFTFLVSVGGVLTAPAWQAIVPQLVPKQDLAPAVTANSVGFNVSRAVGPALGGAVIAGFGIAAPFWVNAISNFAVLGALLWWRSSPKSGRHLPAERFGNAIITGIRYARYNVVGASSSTRARHQCRPRPARYGVPVPIDGNSQGLALYCGRAGEPRAMKRVRA
jgi:MFS family permease